MQTLLDDGLPVASSCSGEGVCSKCKIQILEGQENLSPPNETEKFLKQTNSIPDNERISCQTLILGDVKVDTNYW